MFLRNITLSLLFCTNVALCRELPLKIDLSGCPTDRNLSSWCVQTLQEQQNDLQEQLLKLLDIEKADWERKKENHTPELMTFFRENLDKQLTGEPIPQEILEPTYDLLTNRKVKKMLGIVTVDKDPEGKKLVALKNDGGTITVACANDSFGIEVGTDHLNILLKPEEVLETHNTPEEIQATIAHELIHILYEDVLDTNCLHEFYMQQKQKRKIPRRKFMKLVSLWERGQEARADILSGLIDIKLAQAHEAIFFRHKPKRKPRLKSKSVHPTDWQRHAYMKQLVNEMKEREPKSTGYSLWLVIFCSVALCIIFLLLIKDKLQFLKK